MSAYSQPSRAAHAQRAIELGAFTTVLAHAIAWKTSMVIEFDLNRNGFDALMRHCQTLRPETGDNREDQRLLDALEALQEAIHASDKALLQN